MYLKDLVKFGENGGAVFHPKSPGYARRFNGRWIYANGKLYDACPRLPIEDWMLDSEWDIVAYFPGYCPACRGKGWAIDPETPCPVCSGTGKAPKKPEKQYAFKLLTLDGKSPFAKDHGGKTLTYPVDEWVDGGELGVFVANGWSPLQAGGVGTKNHLIALMECADIRAIFPRGVFSSSRVRRLPSEEVRKVLEDNPKVRGMAEALRIGPACSETAGFDWLYTPEPVIVNRVRGDKTPVPEGAMVREWRLEQSGERIRLRCNDLTGGSPDWYVAGISQNCKLDRVEKIDDPTIPTDERGRILLAE